MVLAFLLILMTLISFDINEMATLNNNMPY